MSNQTYICVLKISTNVPQTHVKMEQLAQTALDPTVVFVFEALQDKTVTEVFACFASTCHIYYFLEITVNCPTTMLSYFCKDNCAFANKITVLTIYAVVAKFQPFLFQYIFTPKHLSGY